MSFLPRTAAGASLVVDLARIVGAQHVSSLDADRLAYSHDCWPRDILRLRAGEVPAAPLCVVWPGSADEVARVLKYAEEVQLPVVPYGVGSGVAGGARPSEGGVVLDMKRLSAIRELDEVSLRAEIECGIIGERLERKLNAKGYTLGHFPSSIMCSTLGGWLAARSAGQMSTLYGKIEDMALGLEVVTPGRIRRLMLGPRPADGPDFNALVMGSEGCFGAVTAAELRIRPLPERRELRGYRFRGVKAGLEAIRKILRAQLRPAVVRLYDSLDTFLGRSKEDDAHDEVASYDALARRSQGFFDELARRLPFGGVDAAARLRKQLLRGAVRAVLGAPLVLNRALEVLPDDCLFVVGFEGQPALVAAEEALARELCTSEGATDLGPGPGEHWLKRRYQVSFKQSKMFASGLFVDTMEVAATWDRLFALYGAVRRAIARDAVVLAHFSHAYPEGCSIYFTFAAASVDPSDPGEAIERYDRIWRNALVAVHETGGTISHHHGVGESKAHGMAREHGPGGMRLLAALKQAFDPAGIMNPGKLGLVREKHREPRSRPASVREESSRFPPEIVAAVGERNIIVTGGRSVFRPPDESALAAVLRIASPRSISVVSDQTGFRAPQGPVQLDLSLFDGVSRLSEHSLFVEVEAGVVVERLERLLNGHGLTLGHLHPRAVTRSVGAALARNLLIRRAVGFGDLRDVCFAVRGLLANGSPIETRPVPRSATGPELDRAFIAAQGRLGIITRATLRVAVAPAHREEAVFVFASLENTIRCARIVLRRGVRASAGRVVPASGGPLLALEIVAQREELLRAQQAVVSSAAAQLGGERVPGVEPIAAGGRFDAIVEAASLWSRAEEALLAMSAAGGGEAWLDFLAPEGVTVVARVVDAESRRAAVLAAARAGARVIAGSRETAYSDLESFSLTLGARWRDVPFEELDRRSPGPYEDVLLALSEKLDPNGVFRGRS